MISWAQKKTFISPFRDPGRYHLWTEGARWAPTSSEGSKSTYRGEISPVTHCIFGHLFRGPITPFITRLEAHLVVIWMTFRSAHTLVRAIYAGSPTWLGGIEMSKPIGSMLPCAVFYLHFGDFYGRCRYIHHTWNRWEKAGKTMILEFITAHVWEVVLMSKLVAFSQFTKKQTQMYI